MSKKFKQLSLDDRIKIQAGIEKGLSLAKIAILIDKHKSTISSEIKTNSVIEQKGVRKKRFNDCLHRNKCSGNPNCLGILRCPKSSCSGCDQGCGKGLCSKYEKEVCPLLFKSPFVCNNCDKRKKCPLEHIFYIAKRADDQANFRRKKSREGVAITEKEAIRIGAIVKDGLDKHQGVYHIMKTHKADLMFSKQTLYNYIGKGVFPNIGNLDLERKVKYKPRKTTSNIRHKVDKACRRNRTYDDYLAYVIENPEASFVQMDCVESTRGDSIAAVLTIHFVAAHFQLAFLLESKTAFTVEQIFNSLKITLGEELYKKHFANILSDNGSEFSDPESIESHEGCPGWSRVFYCDPNRSDQKGACEKNHTYLRLILKRGVPFSSYELTQEKVNLMISHINSAKRASLNGKTPYEAFCFLYGSELLDKLGIVKIAPEKVTLAPKLFK